MQQEIAEGSGGHHEGSGGHHVCSAGEPVATLGIRLGLLGGNKRVRNAVKIQGKAEISEMEREEGDSRMKAVVGSVAGN